MHLAITSIDPQGSVSVAEADMNRRFLPALGILAGGLVHSLLPVGAFGKHDRVVRAVIVGIVSGATSMLILILTD